MGKHPFNLKLEALVRGRDSAVKNKANHGCVWRAFRSYV